MRTTSDARRMMASGGTAARDGGPARPPLKQAFRALRNTNHRCRAALYQAATQPDDTRSGSARGARHIVGIAVR